jgi:CubicO group peptidase (beta-lactamase class C family)
MLEDIRVKNNSPALAAGVILPNRSVTAQVVGFRKQGDSTMATIEDEFHLGSNTKAMTAFLIAKYIERGNPSFTWNSTILELNPPFARSMSSDWRNVTLAMLGSHTAGFTNDTILGNKTFYESLAVLTAVDGRRAYAEKALSQTPVTQQGQFNYSNVNYILLGALIDNFFGPWEHEIEQQLFKPLGMNSCGNGNIIEYPPNATNGLWPHTPGNPPKPISPNDPISDNLPLLGPAGRIRCSLKSYSRFLAMHLDGLKGYDTPVLKAASFKVLHKPFGNVNYTPGGWLYAISSNKSLGSILFHDGSNNYNYAEATLFPLLDSALVAVTNVGDATQAVSDVGNAWASGVLPQMPIIS